MTHLDNILGYTALQMANWPADSYAGRERDLADLMSDYTLEALETALDIDEFAAYTIFILMMMLPTHAARELTSGDLDEDELGALLRAIQDDARDDSSEPFQARLAQRIALRASIRRNYTTIKD
jgi:hypothetical protein